MLAPKIRPHPGDMLDHYQLESIVSTTVRADVFRAVDIGPQSGSRLRSLTSKSRVTRQ